MPELVYILQGTELSINFLTILKIVKSNIFTEEMYFLNVSEKNAATKIF